VGFSERRGRVLVRGVPGGTRAQFDSAQAEARRTTRSSTIVLDFPTGTALLANDGGGRPDESIAALISDVASNPRFDRPLRRALMLAARCRGDRDYGVFEFRVEKPAVYVGGTSVSPHPSGTGATVVQFVVDTTGAIRPGTFKVLRAEDDAIVAEARRVLAQWRYLPAEIDGHKVPGLVQTAIAR
jgi:hypothetical protein